MQQTVELPQAQHIDELVVVTVVIHLPVHRQDRGYASCVATPFRTVDFSQVQYIEEIVDVTAVMRDRSHRSSTMEGSSMSQSRYNTRYNQPDGTEDVVGSAGSAFRFGDAATESELAVSSGEPADS